MFKSKIKIVDSGSGAYNTISHLIEINKGYKKYVEPFILPSHIGDKTPLEIAKTWDKMGIKEQIGGDKIFMACNSLNSIFPKYEGLFNELIKYIKLNRDKSLLIPCTQVTADKLNSFKFKNVQTLRLNLEVVKDIDRGKLPKIELKTSLFDKLVLGCSHYDLIQFNTNMDIISTSKMGAYKLKEIIKKGGIKKCAV